MVVVVEDMGLFDEIPTRDYALFRTYNLKRATRNIQSIIGHSSSPHSARLFIYVEWPMVNDAVIDVSLSLRLASLSAAPRHHHHYPVPVVAGVVSAASFTADAAA